jgi:hypothetical protein
MSAGGGRRERRPAVPLHEHVEDLSTEVLHGRLDAWRNGRGADPGCCTTLWSPRRSPGGGEGPGSRGRSAA